MAKLVQYLILGVIMFWIVGTFSSCGKTDKPAARNVAPAAPAAPIAGPEWGQRYLVDTDPGAHYWLRSIAVADDGRVTFDSMRIGKSGTSYASRIVDCRRMTFAYTREADSYEVLIATPRERVGASGMGPLTARSISTDLSLKACGRAF